MTLYFAPSALPESTASPRALPWAITFRAFGAESPSGYPLQGFETASRACALFRMKSETFHSSVPDHIPITANCSTTARHLHCIVRVGGDAIRTEVNTLDTKSNIALIEVPVKGNGGIVWNRLHSEREDICEALLKEAGPGAQARLQELSAKDEVGRAANWHRELLQSRLRKIDDALDRLMSGSYGNCCKCGRWIEDTKLDFDPTVAFCIECWQREQKQAEARPIMSYNKLVSSRPALFAR
jgi:RNA polymerase-binding transcription factor DksA